MKKNLFLTCALALFAVVGVSAQNWSRTLATGLPGQEITHDVNGTSVTQYRAETALIKNAGATGVRYTVMQTTATGAYGGGPFFCIGEMIVLDAQGDTIKYTATSNADHNSGGAGKDGDGLPALNDGNFNNYFHSSWGGTEPGGLHYLELTFAEPVDEFQLIWYTRPNQHVNRPQVVGLTNPGVTFTEDMLYAEYEFSLGEKATTNEEIAAGGAFSFFVTGPAEYDGTEGNGDTFVSLSGYATGKNAEASPTTMVQLIPTKDGKFILYQPVLDTYYANPDRWTDGYNGKNGWLRAYSEGWTLGIFDITANGKGEFEITTELTRQYVDGAWVDYDAPLKVWVGYDMRGNLKIFPEKVKLGLEAGDYSLGFDLPVDFGFELYKASVNAELVPPITGAQLCTDVLTSTLETAAAKKELYAEYADYDWYSAADVLEAAIAGANNAIAAEDVAGAFEAKTALEEAIAGYVAIKAAYYATMYEEEWAPMVGDYVSPPYNQSQSGKYTVVSYNIVERIGEIAVNIVNNSATMSTSQIESDYATIESLLASLEGTRLYFSTFPEIVSDIPADNFPYAELPNNAVWKKNVVLAEGVNGVRLTFLDRHIGSAGDGGNFPMIAIGELKIYDANGTEVTLAAENFEANYTETQEGFESTVARLCDGNFGAQGYYHSPWSGNEPQEFIWIDIEFPAEMTQFTIEVYSRDKTTSRGKVSLFPKKVAITKVNEGYDPLLFEPNPYNVFVGDKVASVDEITADGIYVIKGLLNTQAVYTADEDGYITLEGGEGSASYYHGVSRFHANSAAVRAQGVYRFVPNGDGTFKALNLGLAKYWPSTEATGFVGNGTTFEADKAANITVVPSTNVEGAFVMYEKIEGLTTKVAGDSIDTDEDGVFDAVGDTVTYNTPYVVFMDWYSGLATRPVKDPQPLVDKTVSDSWGDKQCFNKANGEGEWEIYKVTMDNPDFFYLTNLTGAFDELGLIVGTDPGCVSDLGALERVLAAGQQVVADSAFADAPAAAAALAKEIAAVANLQKNPMEEGVYQVVSANPDFAKNNKTMALFATVDEAGAAEFGWKALEEGNIEFYFHFTKSENALDFVAGGTITEEQKDLLYAIKAIATYEGATPYYIGESDAQSTQIDLLADAWSDYLVLGANGSAFSFTLAGKDAKFSIHANGHSGGAGNSGNIVYWNADAGASQWYLRKVDYDLETSIEDLVVEGAEVVSVAYFTPAGAAIPAPVEGVNIVVTVYANGVVETKKVLVK
ncbi:MAG: hypothetical protein E7088_08400 [Bacteroidales bacterium]|nr:hypothetical protein [Bacteroidales bacterium]